jgi:hypothetical protein
MVFLADPQNTEDQCKLGDPMTFDGIKTQFHITPRGWFVGSQAIFGPMKDAEARRPVDAVATFEETIHQASEGAPESKSWTQVWRKEDASDASVDNLLDKFGNQGNPR